MYTYPVSVQYSTDYIVHSTSLNGYNPVSLSFTLQHQQNHSVLYCFQFTGVKCLRCETNHVIRLQGNRYTYVIFGFDAMDFSEHILVFLILTEGFALHTGLRLERSVSASFS